MKRYMIILLVVSLASCRNSSFLDAHADFSRVVPATLDDYQAILDNVSIMNGGQSTGVLPALGEMSSDDYFFREATYHALSNLGKDLYTWSPAIRTDGRELNDWAYPYRTIYYANIVLDALKEFRATPAEQRHFNQVKGTALFYRAFFSYQLAQVYAPAYTEETAAEPGIPLRRSADVNERIRRSTLEETYQQIRVDLEEAENLLPDLPAYKTRPSRWAVRALLARMYVSMAAYGQALEQADNCLAIQDRLMDYNVLDTLADFPMPLFNDEVIFHATLVFGSTSNTRMLSVGGSCMDSTLYNSYTADDLRRTLFVIKRSNFNYFGGSYAKSQYLFGGLATDEVWLIRAECLARLGKAAEALEVLNRFRETRFKKNRFRPLVVEDDTDVLPLILAERRMQLQMRGLRWSDLRRLNKESRFQVTLRRFIGGETYVLPPDDPRYTLPIPETVIGFHPDMVQNDRYGN